MLLCKTGETKRFRRVAIIEPFSAGKPGRAALVTLDDLMQYTPVHTLLELAGLFAASETECKRAMTAIGPQAGNLPIPEELRGSWIQAFENAKASREFGDMAPFAILAINRLLEAMKNPETKLWGVGELLRDLQRRISDESSRQLYFRVSQDAVILLAKPLDGWTQTMARFHGAEEDIREAGACISVDRWTASVFHSMRILEHGLGALAGKFGVLFTRESWHKVIQGIEDAIAALREKPGLDDHDRENIMRCSSAAAELRYFKDAWRNHVMHARSSYDSYQASSIYVHVRDFMNKTTEIV